MTTHLKASSALLYRRLELELERWPLPDPAMVAIVGDPPTIFEGRILWTSDDGRRAIGIQRCSPCVMRGVHVDG